MPHSLSFKFKPLTKPTDPNEEYPFVRVATDLIVDGESATSHFFDLGLVLAMGATPLEDAYIFTCGCGAPGCAGIFESGAIEVSEDLVTWVLPREPFASSVRADLVPPQGPLRIEFARPAYEEALEQATLELEALSRAAGFPVDIWPGSSGPECPEGVPRTLREELAVQREHILDWEERMKWREETYGELLSFDLLLTLPNGFIYSIPYENLADAAVSDGYDWVENAQEMLDDEIVPRLHQGFDSVVALARSLSWAQLVTWHLFEDDNNPESLTADAYKSLTEWPHVTFSVRKDRYAVIDDAVPGENT